MKIKEAIGIGQSLLRDVSSTPQKDTLILLAFMLEKNITYVISRDNELINEKRFMKLIKRLHNFEPIEYITNKADFYGRDFFVDKRVLIPRPATEDVIEKLLNNIDRDNFYNIAEIGVGSGAISVTLAKFLPKAMIIATDICEDAIKVAIKNINTHKVNDRVSVVHTNLLDNITQDLDIIISNPPYISNSFKLPKNVEHEPKGALFSKDDGLYLIKEIVDLAIERNVKILIIEMGYDQKDRMTEYLKNTPFKYTFFKDFEDIDRGFICIR